MRDVAIVGGGPAGLAAGIHAARAGLGVTLFEAREGPVDKCCGEGIMPAGLVALDALGVGVSGHPFLGVRYQDHVAPERFAEGRFPSGPGRGVRRLELNAALQAAAVSAGVEIRRARATVDPDEDQVLVNGEPFRWLVAADGLNSPIRHQLGLDRPRQGARFGVRRHYSVAPWRDRVEVHWRAGVEAYVTPVSADTVGVAFLFSEKGRFEDLLAGFPLLAERLSAPITDARGAGPFGARARSVRAGRVLLIGDAAGYRDALTGEGIALALATAKAAVDCVAEGRPERYPRRWARATRRFRWATGALLRLTRPRWVHRPLIGLLRRCPWVFDRALGVLGDPD